MMLTLLISNSEDNHSGWKSQLKIPDLIMLVPPAVPANVFLKTCGVYSHPKSDPDPELCGN